MMNASKLARSPHTLVWLSACALGVMQACSSGGSDDDVAIGGGDAVRRNDGTSSSSSSGDESSSNGGSPDASPASLSLVQLSTLANHTCALWSDGQLKCWGNNVAGQLGYGDTQNRGGQPGEMGAALPFVDVGESHRVKQVSVGYTFTCALLEDATVKCWGDNPVCGPNSDQNCGLGYGDKKARGDGPGEMGDKLPAIDLGAPVKQLGCGSFNCCALLTNDTIKCWGENVDGNLGYGDTNARGDEPGEMGNDLPPVDVGVTGVATVKMGNAVVYQHTCAALKNGTLTCWGANLSGQLGIGDTNSRGDDANEMGTALAAVPTGQLVADVALGDSSTCALLEGGAVRCWGANATGQLGYGDTLTRGNAGNANFPLVQFGGSATSITQAGAAGPGSLARTCVELTDGGVKCWGGNDYRDVNGAVSTPIGALGYGDQLSRGGAPGQMGSALPAIDFGRAGKAMQVVAGSGHTCVRFDDQKVKCWGENFSGSLGLGDDEVRGYRPSQMGDGLPFVDLDR